MRTMRAVDMLEERVSEAVGLIASLRERVQSLERELSTAREKALAAPARPPASPPDPALVEELERLRAERVVIRENIRGLLREFDRISW